MTPDLKLFMILLGCKPAGRHTEQHDIFFGIGHTLADLIPEINLFWPEAADKIHIDAWRAVNFVEGCQIRVTPKSADNQPTEQDRKLFFINLGGYQEDKFEEQHYFLLTLKQDKTSAINEAKQTLFFQKNHFSGAPSHIDDKYGIDVDDLYAIEDILPASQKSKYSIEITPTTDTNPDEIHLGYLALTRLNKSI